MKFTHQPSALFTVKTSYTVFDTCAPASTIEPCYNCCFDQISYSFINTYFSSTLKRFSSTLVRSHQRPCTLHRRSCALYKLLRALDNAHAPFISSRVPSSTQICSSSTISSRQLSRAVINAHALFIDSRAGSHQRSCIFHWLSCDLHWLSRAFIDAYTLFIDSPALTSALPGSHQRS